MSLFQFLLHHLVYKYFIAIINKYSNSFNKNDTSFSLRLSKQETIETLESQSHLLQFVHSFSVCKFSFNLYTLFHQLSSIFIKNVYGPFNIEVVGLKVLITLNMIAYAHSSIILKININQQYYKSSNQSILFQIKIK